MGSCKGNVGALISRMGVDYTIVIIRNPPKDKIGN